MKLLLAVDSITTLNILLDEVVVRSWPKGTEARVLSVVEGEAPLDMSLADERLRSIGIATEVTIMPGNPAELIRIASQKWGTDLILIRAHNRADSRNLMLGSVAQSVVESAPCSVEVVRVADDTYSKRDKRNFKIILATDGSDASLAASQVVAHTNWPESTEVKVVSVVNPVTYSLEEIGLWLDKGTDRAHRAIGEAVQVLKNAPLKVTGELIAGRIDQAIVDRARTWSADLIVLGTHDRRGLTRLFLGATSAVVAKRAHCSVRVVRDRDFKNVGVRRAA